MRYGLVVAVGLFFLFPRSAAFSAVEASGGSSSEAEVQSLDEQLDALSIPTNQAPLGVAAEKLYSVQSRFVKLRHRHELSLGGGKNFNTDSFVTSNNLDLGYHYYLSDRWFLGLSGSFVFNEWSSGADRLMRVGQLEQSTLADVPFAKYRADLLAGYHLFYGKFRLSMDQVFYFDQYVALGPGYVSMEYMKQVPGGYLNIQTVNRVAAVAEAGLVFWFGRSMSMRFSLKDYFVNEIRTKSNGWAHNVIGAVQFGYVFGG